MSCHTTTPKILNTVILSFALVPIETHATTLDLFLTFLAQRKFYHQDFFWSSNSNQVLLLSIYHNQSPNLTHFFHYSKKSSNLTFLHHQKLVVHFLNMHQISSPSTHLLASLKPFCQSSYKNLIHKVHEEFSLNNRDCTPS
jgi:hypothetical protein